MRKASSRFLQVFTTAAAVLALGACVTINVYFPAAEAQQAAEEFVEKVIGEDPATPVGGEPQAWLMPAPRRGFDPLSLLIPSAHAQSQKQLNIRTPAHHARRYLTPHGS